MKLPEKPKKILVAMPECSGGVIRCTPFLAHLRKTYPNSEIGVMCRAQFSGLLTKDTNVDELLTIDSKGFNERRNERRNLMKKLRIAEYDLGLILSKRFFYTWLMFVGNVKQRVGYSGMLKNFILSQRFKSLDALSEGLNINEQKPKLFVSKSEIQECKAKLEKFGIKGSAKRILVDQEMADQFDDQKYKTAIYVKTNEKPKLDRYQLQSTEDIRKKLVTIASLDAVCTSDRELIEMAKALGTRLLSIEDLEKGK